jgi:hypothetical protein
MKEMAGNGNRIMRKTCFLVLAFAAGVSGWVYAAVTTGPGSSEQTPAASADFYVASGGKDSNPGTADEPLATLAKARDLVRERVAAGLTRNILVMIRGGIYEQAATLDFGPQDSGTEKCSITYAANPGEKVVLSGGRRIAGWKKGEGDIWTAELPEVKAGKWYFRQLFVGGRRAVRARTPNSRWWKINTSTAKKEPPPRDAAITLSVNHPIRAWYNISDVELVFLENNEGSRRRLGKVNEAEQTLTIPPPQQSIPRIFEYDWAISIPMAGKACYFENAREMLDEPGEWYLDRQSGVLSYWPRPGEDLRHVEAVAPVVQKTLLSVIGTSTAPVKNLHFKGIYVEHVDWPLPPAGYYGVFGCLIITDGDKPIHKWMDAAVALEHARSCSFTNGGIAHVGGMGVCLLRGTAFDVIDGNEIYDLGGGGIGAGGIRNRSTLKWNPPPIAGDYQGYRITNNHIHDCGIAYFGAIGIFLAMTQDAVVAHNLVHDTAYTGIVICGNEDRQLPFARNNTVQYNHIHHVMKVAGDGSGIYLSFPQAGWGALIRGNLIHDLGRGHGVYLDGVFPRGVRNYRLEKNVMYGSDVFLHLCFEKDNVWVDNVFMKQGPPPQAVLESIRAEVGPRPSKDAPGGGKTN